MNKIIYIKKKNNTHTHTHTHTQRERERERERELNRFCVGMFLIIEDTKGALWVYHAFGSMWYAEKKCGAYRGRSYLAEKELCGLVR